MLWDPYKLWSPKYKSVSPSFEYIFNKKYVFDFSSRVIWYFTKQYTILCISIILYALFQRNFSSCIFHDYFIKSLLILLAKTHTLWTAAWSTRAEVMASYICQAPLWLAVYCRHWRKRPIKMPLKWSMWRHWSQLLDCRASFSVLTVCNGLKREVAFFLEDGWIFSITLHVFSVQAFSVYTCLAAVRIDYYLTLKVNASCSFSKISSKLWRRQST